MGMHADIRSETDAPEQPGALFRENENRHSRRQDARKDRLQAKREARFLRMLQTVDIPQARLFWNEHNRGTVSDNALLIGIHRARLGTAGVSAEQKKESETWLKDLGLL